MMVVSSLFLVACGKAEEAPEQDRFISAMTEATCASFQSGQMDDAASKKQIAEIFSKYGFNVEDDSAMEELQTKYKDSTEVDDALKKAFDDCAPQEFLDAMKSLGGDAAASDDAAAEPTE